MLESRRPVSKEKPLPAQLGEIIGGYELSRVLSHGGMGCVYHAVHVRLGRPAAVKVLAAALALDEELVARFFREARIVNELRHPNIVDIFDFVELENPRRLACIMEYIEGPTLKQVVRKKRLTVAQAINATLQLVGALRVVHSINVIHRDLKPTNIIVTGNLRTDLTQIPSVKMLDFGIAKVEDAPGEHKTASGTMLGTPAYMAPEQVAADSVSPAADIYALGELLYEMVSGRRAFPGSRAEVLRVKMSGALPALPMPQGMRAAEAIRALVMKCIAHDPAERPTLDQFETEVQAIKAYSVEDLGLEILDNESPTEVREVPTQPITISVAMEEIATKVEELEVAPVEEPPVEDVPVERVAPPRSDSSIDENVPITATYPLTKLDRRPKKRWMIGAVPIAIAAVVALIVARGGSDPPQEETRAVERPPHVLEPVTLAPDPQPEQPPAPVRAAPPPSKKKTKSKAIELSSRPSALVLDARTEARLGRTPMTLELPRGATMELLLVAPGRKSQPLTIDGKNDRVAVELEKVRPKRREKRTIARTIDESAPPPSPPPAKPKDAVEMPDW